MDILVFTLLFIFLFAISLFAHWFDKKHNLQLVRWFNCEVKSPFKEKPTHTSAVDSKEYADLKTRVEVLEKIVTDPAWELNQKINKL